MAKVRYKFFEPSEASRLGKLNLMARSAMEGFISGLHRSPHRGFSVEFSEHREYTPGDDTRHLDWGVFGRSDRYYIKQYEQETNLRSHILLDVSRSMGFSAQGRASKFEYACRLAAAMAYLMIQQQDVVGLVAFDSKIRRLLPPGGTPAHLDRFFTTLEELRLGPETAIAETFHAVADRIGRRAQVIVLSDLFDDPRRVSRALQHFRYKKHQVILFHVLDPVELELPFTKVFTFVDMETGQKIQVDPRSIREDYRQELQDFLAGWRREAANSSIEYVEARTSQPYMDLLTSYLAGRRLK